MERFTVLRSVYDALMAYPPEEMKKAFGLIGRYAMDGVLPTETEGVALGLFLSVKALIDDSVRRSQAGQRGGKVSRKQTVSTPEADGKHPVSTSEAPCNQTVSKPEAPCKQTVSTPEANGNERRKKKEESIKETLSEESVKKKHFVPPTLQEVQEYIRQNGFGVDAERFVDYYTANGWHVGKQPMKDWKATVRNWNRIQRQELTAKGQRQEATAENRFCDFPQREYNWGELERKLIGG